MINFFKKCIDKDGVICYYTITDKKYKEPDTEDQVKENKEGGKVQWDRQNLTFNMRVVLHSSSPQERPFIREKKGRSSSIRIMMNLK